MRSISIAPEADANRSNRVRSAAMLRRLFTILSALSLVLFVATWLLWIQSYGNAFYPTFLHLSSSNRQTVATQFDPWSYRGCLGIELTHIHLYSDIIKQSQCYVGSIVCISGMRPGMWMPQVPGWSWEPMDSSGSRAVHIDEAHGFCFHHDLGTNSLYGWYSVSGFSAPCWFYLLLFTVLPAARLFYHRKTARRFRRGRCRACGYDLRATPDRCPECGTVPKKILISN